MAKVGLKDTLSLLAKGYSKKDIEALAAIDEEHPDTNTTPAPVPDEKPASDPVPQAEKPEEPDYKAMYEELLKKSKETEAKVTKLQQDNVHKDSAPASAEAKQKEQESLEGLFRSFM